MKKPPASSPQPPEATSPGAPDEQWWLAKVDTHGNPTLMDGAHGQRRGAEEAMGLHKALGTMGNGVRLAVVQVFVYPPKSADDVPVEMVGPARLLQMRKDAIRALTRAVVSSRGRR